MITVFPKELVSKSELQVLDHFLRNQKSINGNPSSLTYTHGFLCAVLTAPTLPHYNHYSLLLTKITQGENGASGSKNTNRACLARLGSQMSDELEQNSFTPLLFENDVLSCETAPSGLLKEWCLGYLHGVGLDASWAKDDMAVSMLMPIAILADEFDLVGLFDAEGHAIADNKPHKMLAREILPKIIADLYSYWGKQRSSVKGLNKDLH